MLLSKSNISIIIITQSAEPVANIYSVAGFHATLLISIE